MKQLSDAISVFTTAGSKKEAQTIADVLVKEKLAACVQMVSAIQSTYVWKKKVCRDKEFLLIIKTRKKLFSRVSKMIQKYHSYDVPEVVAFPIIKGSSPYLQWMKQCLRSK